jgi:hypothetical protein
MLLVASPWRGATSRIVIWLFNFSMKPRIILLSIWMINMIAGLLACGKISATESNG